MGSGREKRRLYCIGPKGFRSERRGSFEHTCFRTNEGPRNFLLKGYGVTASRTLLIPILYELKEYSTETIKC